ncbi:MAG: hypothetical protein ACI30H_03355 [Paludibacteraceae bacterium]
MKILNKKILKEIIRETLDNINSNMHGNLKISNNENDYSIITIKDDDSFNKWSNLVWTMLVLSYENNEGLKTYRNFSDFINKRHIIEIVLDDNNMLLACATYRRIESSLKMVACGCNQSIDGKNALQYIIKNNIDHSDLHYWAEVSGAIEHYFKKHNGYPMPNTLASEILNINENELVLSKDFVHYDRPIGVHREIFTKMIFGIKSEEIFQKAINEVKNYASFMKEINKINENSNGYTIKQSIYIIENIYRAHEEDGFNELIPSWHKALIDSLDVLKKCTNKNQTINDYIQYCEYLLNDMQLLEIHKLNI